MWIETNSDSIADIAGKVTPHVGVWIETANGTWDTDQLMVTPHVGVWIETLTRRKSPIQLGHTSCRCVD